MDPYRLLKDEVENELVSRGLNVTGSAGELRKRLHVALRSFTPYDSKVELDTTSELEICKNKLTELKQLIVEFQGPSRDKVYNRLDTRLTHLFHRITRIPKTDQEVETTRTGYILNMLKIYLRP